MKRNLFPDPADGVDVGYRKHIPFPTIERDTMPITKNDAMRGGVFHYTPACGPKRTERWRANGKCITWKRDPERFRLPVKYGLYNYGYIDQTNADNFHRAEDCPHFHY